MTPDFKILAAGVSITRQVKDRLLSLSISDEAGLKSDQVEITLDDRDNALELPLPGAPLAVFLGFKETFLMPMGVFTADEVTAKGPPDTITIRAKAADLGGSMKSQKTRAWDDKTIGQIVETIAGEHKLEAKVAKACKDYHYDHLDQTEESDLTFLIRIAKDHDALATVKSGALLFIGQGEGLTASGLPMLPVPVRKTGQMSWSMTLATREAYKAAEAMWHDKATGKKEKVTEGKGEPVKKLRHTHATKEDAQRAAKAALGEVARGNDTLEITMPGNPLLAAEGRILALGFRTGIPSLWSIKSARHTLSGSGFTTTISCEKPNAGGG